MRRVQGSNLLELALTSFQDLRITVLPTLLRRVPESNWRSRCFADIRVSTSPTRLSNYFIQYLFYYFSAPPSLKKLFIFTCFFTVIAYFDMNQIKRRSSFYRHILTWLVFSNSFLNILRNPFIYKIRFSAFYYINKIHKCLQTSAPACRQAGFHFANAPIFPNLSILRALLIVSPPILPFRLRSFDLRLKERKLADFVFRLTSTLALRQRA